MYFQTNGERKGAWKKPPKLLNYQKTKRRKKQRKGGYSGNNYNISDEK